MFTCKVLINCYAKLALYYIFIDLLSQIEEYVDKVASQCGTDLGASTSTAATPSIKDLVQRHLQLPSVKDLVRNPFVLKLFVEALPHLPEAGQGHITRYKVYQIFTSQWCAREVERMPPARKAELGLPVGGHWGPWRGHP